MWLSRLLPLVTCASLLLSTSPRAASQAIVGEVFASDASVRGSVVLAQGGTSISSGSTVTAGEAPALVRLARGGEVRVCPSTSLSVTASPNGRDLLLGLNAGALEANYELENSADAILTPDFRVMLIGPGIFHFAFGANARGDACIRGLPSSTAGLLVAEQNGDATYRVRPGEDVLFRNGRVADAEHLVSPDCGCPAAALPILRAEAKPPAPVPPPSATSRLSALLPAVAPPAPAQAGPPQSPPARDSSAELHVQVEAPFVFRASDSQQELETIVARMRLTDAARFPIPAAAAPERMDPAAADRPGAAKTAGSKPSQSRRFFGRVRSFFARLFR